MNTKQLIIIAIIAMALLGGGVLLCSCDAADDVQVNVEGTESLSGNVFGKDALIEIGSGLWYDQTTRIVYFWNGTFYARSSTMPAPYYSSNGKPYRFNPETNTFEEIATTK